jgi:low temperature requirement protein LtrA
VDRRKVLRERSGNATARITSTELFFDLVYVFAITQLSEFLSRHLSARGGSETLILFLAVWSAWNYRRVRAGGPILYLARLIMFKRSVHHGAVGPPLLGIAVLALVSFPALMVDRLVLCLAVAAILAALAVAAGLSGSD